MSNAELDDLIARYGAGSRIVLAAKHAMSPPRKPEPPREEEPGPPPLFAVPGYTISEGGTPHFNYLEVTRDGDLSMDSDGWHQHALELAEFSADQFEDFIKALRLAREMGLAKKREAEKPLPLP